MGKDARPGDKFEIEIDEDGEVTYTKIDSSTVDLGTSYYLTGTSNDWGYDAMEEDAEMVGLYTSIVTLGESGQEEFQIVADQDEDMTFSPKMEQCTMKSAPVFGPGKA